MPTKPSIIVGMSVVTCHASGTFAVSKPVIFTANCRIVPSKSALPAGLCDDFILTLEAAGIGPIVPAAGQQGDVTLVVTAATIPRFSARIDRGKIKGAELAAARKGRAFDRAAFMAFFIKLIAATPSLKNIHLRQKSTTD